MRKLMWTLGGGAVGFVLAVVIMRFVLGVGGDTTITLATSAPPIPVVTDAAPGNASTMDPSTPASPSDMEAESPPTSDVAPAKASPATAEAAAASTDAPFHFKADPAQSSTKILVTQTSVLGDALLVATGSNVAGDIYLTNDGRLGDSQSVFQLDLRTLRSSDSELSSFLRNQLEASAYPYGQFAIESTSGIPANYVDGPEFTFKMTGPLTMHGRTRSITWTARARHAGEFLTFAADADFLLTDYGWTPPDYGVARAKNSVHIQVTVIARKDSAGSSEQVRIATSATSTGNREGGTTTTSSSSLVPALSSGSPLLSSPSTSSAGIPGLVPSSERGATSLTSLLGGLGTLLTGNASGLPSFGLEDLMKMLGGLGGNNSLFGPSR